MENRHRIDALRELADENNGVVVKYWRRQIAASQADIMETLAAQNDRQNEIDLELSGHSALIKANQWLARLTASSVILFGITQLFT